MKVYDYGLVLTRTEKREMAIVIIHTGISFFVISIFTISFGVLLWMLS